jgi:hypothetical protein
LFLFVRFALTSRVLFSVQGFRLHGRRFGAATRREEWSVPGAKLSKVVQRTSCIYCKPTGTVCAAVTTERYEIILPNCIHLIY